MLRPERGQPEFPGCEPIGYREVFRNEQLIVNPAILTRLRRDSAGQGAEGFEGATVFRWSCGLPAADWARINP
jgi:hypothetical protein